MRKRLVTAGLVVGAMSLMLVGCSSESPKDEYINAYKKVQDANTLDATYDITFEDGTDGAYDKTHIVVDVLSDRKNDQHEANLKVSIPMDGQDINIELPMRIDAENEKVYTTTEGFSDIFSTVLGIMGMPFKIDVPEELAGKAIELEGDDFGVGTGEEKEKAKSDVTYGQAYFDFMSEIDEKDYSKKDGVISYTVDGEKIMGLLMENIDVDSLDMDEFGISGSDLTDGAEYGETKVTALVKKGVLEGEKFRVPVKTVDEDNEEIEVLLVLLIEYNEINGKVDFKIDISEDNVTDIDTLMGDMFEGMNF